MTKQDLRDIVESLPEDAPFDKIIAQLRKSRVIAELEAGLEEYDRGEVVSHEEIKRRAEQWKQNR